MRNLVYLLVFSILFSCKSSDDSAIVETPENFYYKSIKLDGLNVVDKNYGVSRNPEFVINFSAPVDKQSATQQISILNAGGINVTFSNGDSTVHIVPKNQLAYLSKYTFQIFSGLLSQKGNKLNREIHARFITQIDLTDKFPRVSDEELLTIVQKQTFKYFWDFAHPVSGLIRERNTSGDLVTSGGSGFGVMCIPVAVERGFVRRSEGLARLLKITDFLLNKAERFHGVFPHWLNGYTGKTIAFSSDDDGGDLVETSFLIQGLLTARQYFNLDNESETKLRTEITKIWTEVEWNWHEKNSRLLWHWSPNYGFAKNVSISGWNEALITYVLAASSPTFPISAETYKNGWTRNGAFVNSGSYYGFALPLGPNLGGPLFFEHYSFLGLNPAKLKDTYTEYWQQVVNHSKINYAYCVANPQNYNGYSADSWGLTASDNHLGYSAHSPTNDLGVISPTAALSSLPYAPEESMQALRFFYYKLGDKLFKEYGFIDAFNLTETWFAESFLAIDQGPIIIMIENYRSQLCWNLFMKDKEVEAGLVKLGF